ncbi:MAG TPA: Fic family protein [Symbiobacteriaceae bacterium]|jgi:Fic family protein
MTLEHLLSEIDKKKATLDRRRPLPPATVSTILEAVRLEWTYHSNALEGNTLTLRETQVVLQGLTIGGGKTLREHLEVMNHVQAVDYLEDVVHRKEPLTEFVARQLHALILRGIDDEHAGKWRTVPVAITGSEHVPPAPSEVPPLMHDLFTWCNGDGETVHPVCRAARFHHRFVYIHPFVDGNGRTARLLTNLILMAVGYPPAIIKADPDRRIAYLDALEEASVRGDLVPFELVVAQAVNESLERYLNWTGGLGKSE